SSMYRISILNCSTWVLLLVPIGVIVGGLLAAFVVYVAMISDGPNKNETLDTIGGICMFPAAIFLIAGFIGGYSYYEACQNGTKVVLDDQLTIHYPWPMGTKVYNWDQIGGISAVDEQVAVQDTIA